MIPSHWSAESIDLIRLPAPTLSIIRRRELLPLLPGFDLWDFWPVQERDGTVARIGDGELFFFLSAPAQPDPEDRHAIARLRLFRRVADCWTDLGPALPDGHSPGSREWAGSAVVSANHRYVTLYFTVAGRRGETVTTFEQRLFETTAALHSHGDRPSLNSWSAPVEIAAPDGTMYMRDMAGGGGLGTIKAFRDPAYFCDPRDGLEYLLFAASLAQSSSHWNGAIGVAVRANGQWQLRPPIIAADGVNNELERPHVIVRNGRYYCFWSTQRKVFADGISSGPDGLYGMVADGMSGPWVPLNDSGLVVANPPAAPHQAYSWLVLPDLAVLSFAAAVEAPVPPDRGLAARAAFGGCPAPEFRIDIDGDRAWPV